MRLGKKIKKIVALSLACSMVFLTACNDRIKNLGGEDATIETTTDVPVVDTVIRVTGLTVSDVSEDSVTIKWDPCLEAEVNGYYVYWADKDTESMQYKNIALVAADTYTFTLKKATHVNHYFKVAASLEDGRSELTDAVRSDTLAQFNVKLEKLDRGLVAATVSNGVFLSWRLLGNEVSGYNDTGLTGVNFNVYQNGNKIAYVTDSTNYLVEKATASDTFYVEAVAEDGSIINASTDTIVCTADNYIDIPLQKPADGVIDRDITIVTGQDEEGNDIYYDPNYTYSANDVSVGDVDGDGEYEYFVKWDPSNAKDVSQLGFTGNVYIDCYKLDGTLLYRIDLGQNVRAGAHYTQFSVYDFNSDGKAEISLQTAPGTKVIKYVDGDQTKGIASEAYITIPSVDAAEGVTNESDYMLDAAQYREYLIGVIMDWGVWANDTEDMKAAKATWNKNIETLWGVPAARQVAGHEGPYTKEEAEKLYDYFVDIYAPARSARNTLRNFEGFNLYGPEYLTVFAGATGEEMDTIAYPVDRGDDGMLWGDYAMNRIEPGNRVDRFLSGMAFLDGENPYIIAGRGYYTRSTVTALKLTAAGKLEQYWQIDSGWTVMNNPFYDGPHGINGTDEDAGTMTCQGNHQLMAADVDGDGFQEIIYGGAIVDHDGTLYSSGTGIMRNGSEAKFGHGDSLHITDIDPDRPGLEIFSCFEGGASAPYGTALRDAETNMVIFGDYSGKDTGRCMIGDLDPDIRGLETWGFITRSAVGAQIRLDTIGTNQNIKYSADMTTQIITSSSSNGAVKVTELDNGVVKTLQDCADTLTNNGTKGNAALVADLFGDWREEIVLRKTDSQALRIYTSTEVTNHKLYTLMHDTQYRTYVACQQTGYNQPAYTSFYFASDTDWEYVPIPSLDLK